MAQETGSLFSVKGKDISSKCVPAFNYAPSNDVWASKGTTPHILDRGTTQPHTTTVLPAAGLDTVPPVIAGNRNRTVQPDRCIAVYKDGLELACCLTTLAICDVMQRR